MTERWISRDNRPGSPPYFLWNSEPILDGDGYYNAKRKNGRYMDFYSVRDFRVFFPGAPRLTKGQKMQVEIILKPCA